MPILITTSQGSVAANAVPFETEAELEGVIASQPNLLEAPGDQPLAFVGRQVDLPDAGLLDLLFVSEAGLPIAAEVKLARNAESRRQVVAQVVDYVSSLTTLTVDELNNELDGTLENALRSFDASLSTDEFERRWQAVGSNLRAGLARFIVVLDHAPADLERIIRFLSDHSNLDVRLVTVSKYANAEIGMLYVPRVVVTAQGEPPPRPSSGRRELRPDLAAVVAAYDQLAPSDLHSYGTASNYRQIRPPEWPSTYKVHYEFYRAHGLLGAELHLENDRAARLAPRLSVLAGSQVGPRQASLEWDPYWSSGRGRLRARYPVTEDPTVIAKSMIDFIAITRALVTEIAAEPPKEPTSNKTMERTLA